MKFVVLILAFATATVLGETVESQGASVELPNSHGWAFAGRTEIPDEGVEIWTTRNAQRRESIQYVVQSIAADHVSPNQPPFESWENGLFADGGKVKILARDFEIAGRKARYIVARWRGRDVPFFHFVGVFNDGKLICFSIISPTDSEFGSEETAKCVRSLRFDQK